MVFGSSRWRSPREFIDFLKLIPAVRKLIDEFREVWNRATSSSTPAWQRALILTGLFEVISTLPVEAPVILALRLATLTAVLQSQGAQARGQESDEDLQDET